MAFENLKEQLKDQWAELTSKIQESTTYNNVREKFEEQSPVAQKAIVFGGSALIVIVLLMFPWSYISDSSDLLDAFEENRILITGLLHAARTVKEPSPLPPPMPAEMLKARVTDILKENRLIPDQIGEMAPLPDKPSKDLAPAVVIQTGLAVQIKKLNVDQITALSNALQTMGPGTKLMGLDIVQSAGQTHYYDIIARVVNFALPEMKMEEAPASGGKKGGARKPKTKSEDEGNE